ncbi:PRP38 family-domain-containing protein [Yarrowia lipolytica]|jgi:pre-mRNA-splicing factor 38A|uniref:Pre-mRNA-splicing factor 38 n=2 Tax=Yarrowia lipolytica TaxID=4952 RepID=Q6C616_YARLI|nr:YALI0E13299p [Yarrowia lipolytica CLIB122]RDW28769.1 PRP38 family-domain-containing protein [Yarrowia lipolytica]RDW35771.1 PRP38 family-domain-containing protein [Yarrowia lipolytica]RDW38745.1 PRP38 family-domain-containing protein [Yarrowia lipolytica]RDW49189.1 PRP38 family-domain-containing protein [Yarrowia lipolytica]RDW54403.1 PRP38 family-domain-containing protein [Yarrowia lipolytica]|eukprot:XP_503896.1 YALI0E13299p [Yarrowia lipolytica CLIB122]
MDTYITDRGMVHGALSIHGINPALLIEKIIRERIFETLYWKELCFNLNAATLCDRAATLTAIGGQYANQKPTPFLCLVFKLLQIQPSHDIIMEYLNQKEFKYLRAVAAFYIRLAYPPVKIYTLLEPLLGDYRKLRFRNMGGVTLTYMDQFIDDLLHEERVCDIALPRLPKRLTLEDAEQLEPREPLIDVSESESEESEEESQDEESEEEGEEDDE